MVSLTDLTALKSKVDNIQREAHRAEGALQQSMTRLKTQFGCSTLKEAEALLKKRKTEVAKAQLMFESAMASFQEEWGDELE